jgi:protein TonB
MARLRYGSESMLAHGSGSRKLPFFVALSVVLHAFIGILLPAARTPALVRHDPLQVTIEKPEPALVASPPPPALEPRSPQQPATAAPKAKPKPRPPAGQKKRAQLPPEQPAVAAPQPPPVLALPPAPSTPEVATPAPAPAREEKPAVAASQEEQPARAASPGSSTQARAPEGPSAPKTTGPISDAAYLNNPQPRYPITARRRGEQGTVMLKVLVTREGSAGSVSVETSSGSTSLDQAALEAVKRWRFVPARRGMQPVEAWHLVPIVFRLEGTS